MIFFSRFRPFLKKKNTYVKWNQKLFTWPFKLIWYGILLLGAVYILCILMSNKTQSKSTDASKVSVKKCKLLTKKICVHAPINL